MDNQDVTSDATTLLPAHTEPNAVTKPSKRPVRRQTHGLTGLLRGRHKPDARQIDGRSSIGLAVSQYKADLVASLGGPANLSTQELTIIEMCAKDWLILQSVDAYLLQAGLFNRKKKTAYPLTIQRMQVADSLTRRLQALGLARRSKPTQTLAELLMKRPEPTEGASTP